VIFIADQTGMSQSILMNFALTMWNFWVGGILVGVTGNGAIESIAVSVTAVMVIMGVLIYLILNYIILSRFEEQGLSAEIRKWPSIIISVAFVFIMLYSGSVALLATLIPISALLIIIVAFGLMLYAIYAVSSKIHAGLKELVPTEGKEITDENRDIGDINATENAARGGETVSDRENAATTADEQLGRRVADDLTDLDQVTDQGTHNVDNATEEIKNVARNTPQAPQSLAALTNRRALISQDIKNSETLLARLESHIRSLTKVSGVIKSGEDYLEKIKKFIYRKERDQWRVHRDLILRHRLAIKDLNDSKEKLSTRIEGLKENEQNKVKDNINKELEAAKKIEEKMNNYEKALTKILTISDASEKALITQDTVFKKQVSDRAKIEKTTSVTLNDLTTSVKKIITDYKKFIQVVDTVKANPGDPKSAGEASALQKAIHGISGISGNKLQSIEKSVREILKYDTEISKVCEEMKLSFERLEAEEKILLKYKISMRGMERKVNQLTNKVITDKHWLAIWGTERLKAIEHKEVKVKATGEVVEGRKPGKPSKERPAQERAEKQAARKLAKAEKEAKRQVKAEKAALPGSTVHARRGPGAR
jgi:hypothetical protein